jgi:hypothetical protein
MEVIGACRSFLNLASGLTLAFLLLLPASAQMSPEAQKDYKQGMAAAEQQSWDQAIADFTAAQKLSEEEPSVLYALGLAHDKAEHDLIGAAWFKAYLAVAPNAPDAADVRNEITRLEQSNTAKMKMIFTASLEAARQIPWDDLRWYRLKEIAYRQAGAGLIDDALATEQEAYSLALTIPANRQDAPGKPHVDIEDRSQVQSSMWQSYIDHLIKLDDVPKAQEALSRVTDSRSMIAAQMRIADGLAFQADYDAAKKLLAEVEQEIDGLPNPADRVSNLLALSKCYIETHKPDMARTVLEKAQSLARTNSMKLSDDDIKNALDEIAGSEDGSLSVEDESASYPEDETRVFYADAASNTDEELNLAAALEKAKQPDPNVQDFSSADLISFQLAEVAQALGLCAEQVDQLDAVYSGNDNRVYELWVIQDTRDHLNVRSEAETNNRQTIQGFRTLIGLRSEAWQQSNKGKAVLEAMDAMDISGFSSKIVQDDKGWTAELFYGNSSKPIYVANERFASRSDLWNSVDSVISEELANWLVSDPKSPLSPVYKAAVEAIQDGTTP